MENVSTKELLEFYRRQNNGLDSYSDEFIISQIIEGEISCSKLLSSDTTNSFSVSSADI